MKHNLHRYFRVPLLIACFLTAATAGINGRNASQPATNATNATNATSPAGIEVSAENFNQPPLSQMLEESGFSGGLAVHIGCGNGGQTAALALVGNFIVQGLDIGRQEIDRAREFARSLELDGRLTFRQWSGGQLPYTDKLVNLIFWDQPGTEEGVAEIMRVLAPNGVAYLKQGSGWEKVTKPWPEEIDEWPHFRYDAESTGAPVSAIDGGIYMYALDPESGELMHQNRLEGPFPDISMPSEAFHEDGYRADLLEPYLVDAFPRMAGVSLCPAGTKKRTDGSF